MFTRLLKFGPLAVVLTGCATTGATLGSGVGDRQLEHPPYYAGQSVATVQPAPRIVPIAVQYQRGASQAAIFDPAAGPRTPVGALVSAMNALIDSLFAGATLSAPVGNGVVQPNVYFGCELDASNDCVERGDSVLGRRGTTMKLAVERPSPEWIATLRARLDSAGATHALLLTLEVGQYWTRQSGMRGAKSVELGTAYTESLPWLTSLETPVTVLQLTGALLDREGKAVRIGAEGLLAVRTPLTASALGAQKLISDADVQRAASLRHSERPGEPLVWRAAVCELVAQLTLVRCPA